LILCSILLASSVYAQNRNVVCYWMPGSTASVNPNICTHVIFSFLGITADGSLTYLWRTAAQVTTLLQGLVALKAQNPNLRALVAIGGYNADLITPWYTLAASSTARQNFARNIQQFIITHNLDGVDIDWEYPNYDGNRPEDKQNFVYLLQDLRTGISPQYLLTTAIGAGAWRTNLSYDIPSIFHLCDFVNLMTYDMHGGWEPRTGIHGAMYRGPNDQTDANADFAVQYLIGFGIARYKLIMGIPAYGIGFTLNNSTANGVGAAADSGGYYEFYQQMCLWANAGWNQRFEEAQMVPYMFQGDQWFGYDNVRSVEHKSNYINTQALGGAMFWELTAEDWNNSCGGGTWPLINAAYRIVHG